MCSDILQRDNSPPTLPPPFFPHPWSRACKYATAAPLVCSTVASSTSRKV